MPSAICFVANFWRTHLLIVDVPGWDSSCKKVSMLMKIQVFGRNGAWNRVFQPPLQILPWILLPHLLHWSKVETFFSTDPKVETFFSTDPKVETCIFSWHVSPHLQCGRSSLSQNGGADLHDHCSVKFPVTLKMWIERSQLLYYFSLASEWTFLFFLSFRMNFPIFTNFPNELSYFS